MLNSPSQSWQAQQAGGEGEGLPAPTRLEKEAPLPSLLLGMGTSDEDADAPTTLWQRESRNAIDVQCPAAKIEQCVASQLLSSKTCDFCVFCARLICSMTLAFDYCRVIASCDSDGQPFS